MDESGGKPTRPCRRCGTIKVIGVTCRECIRAWRARRAAEQPPCGVCGARDRDACGNCRPCRDRCNERRVAARAPCRVCGSIDRYPSGICRPCRKTFKMRMAATGQPCRVCGSTDRNRSGNCRQCTRARRYGISREQFESMANAQGGVCAICGDPPDARGLNVDHSHATNMIRALLCNACNAAIGLLREDVDRLLAAANYIARFRDGITPHVMPALRACSPPPKAVSPASSGESCPRKTSLAAVARTRPESAASTAHSR